MRRALFDILCVGDAIEQVYSVAANVTDLRRAVSILKGMVNEVSEIVQLDLLDAASSQLWVRHISKEPQAGTASPDKMWESLNTAAGGLHSYWVASIRKRSRFQPGCVLPTLLSDIQPILEASSNAGTWFRVCFLAKASFWLRIDDEWAYPLVSTMLAPSHPDNKSAWVGILYDGAVVGDRRLRSILYNNYQRLLDDPDFFVERPEQNGLLTRRFFEAMWFGTDERRLDIVKDFARTSSLPILESFSRRVYYELKRSKTDRKWPCWLSTYLGLRCLEARDDEAFHIMGALMYNPSANESLRMMKELTLLDGEVDFNSRHTPVLYSLLEARKEAVASGEIEEEVGDAVLSLLNTIAPSYLLGMLSDN